MKVPTQHDMKQETKYRGSKNEFCLHSSAACQIKGFMHKFCDEKEKNALNKRKRKEKERKKES